MQFEAQVLHLPAHRDLQVAYINPQYLLQSGYYRSTGSPRGQRGDYRKRLPDGRGIHVRDFGTHMTVHWDRVDPSHNLLGHLVEDAPGWAALFVFGAAMLFGAATSA